MNAWSKENIGHPLLQVFAQKLCQKLCGSMLEHPFLAKSVKRFWSHCWLLWYVSQDEASLKPGRFVDMNQLKMLIFGTVTSFFNCSFSRVCTRSGQVVWQFYEKLPKIVFFNNNVFYYAYNVSDVVPKVCLNGFAVMMLIGGTAAAPMITIQEWTVGQ